MMMEHFPEIRVICVWIYKRFVTVECVALRRQLTAFRDNLVCVSVYASVLLHNGAPWRRKSIWRVQYAGMCLPNRDISNIITGQRQRLEQNGMFHRHGPSCGLFLCIPLCLFLIELIIHTT